MDKVVRFFKNIWFKRSISALTVVYTVFLGWIAWLSAAYFIKTEDSADATSLFIIYVFINLVALLIFTFTRKIIFTKVMSMVVPLCVFAIVILGFGNWYLIIPPLVVALIIFFVSKTGETAKTVLGTIFLLMYFLGIVGFMVFRIFITDNVSLSGVDLSKRHPTDIVVLNEDKFRAVRYDDSENKNNRRTHYYIEKNTNDVKLPFATAMRVLENEKLITVPYGTKVKIDWINGKLHVNDGYDKIYTQILDENGNFDLKNNVDTDQDEEVVNNLTPPKTTTEDKKENSKPE